MDEVWLQPMVADSQHRLAAAIPVKLRIVTGLHRVPMISPSRTSACVSPQYVAVCERDTQSQKGSVKKKEGFSRISRRRSVQAFLCRRLTDGQRERRLEKQGALGASVNSYKFSLTPLSSSRKHERRRCVRSRPTSVIRVSLLDGHNET